MRNLVIFVCFTISWTEAQNGRSSQHTNSQYNNGHGWDIRLAVPGEPGSDYPTLSTIPRTSFTCAGKDPGYYADIETNCQVFRVCTAGSTYGFQSFLCPNGTLFNQAVFVCDWWMNVNCQRSQLLFNNKNEKFSNLKLGPQLMKDVKKMLTHPMRNPLNKAALKSNLVVMQNYKPPSGQLFPNGALIAGPERTPNNVYMPAKQIQQNLVQSYYSDNSFTASTLSPTYIPAINAIQETPQDTEPFQRQRQNSQYVESNRIQNMQNLQPGKIISNGHAGRLTQSKNTPLLNNDGYSQIIRPTQNDNQGNVQYGQKQISNYGTTQSLNSQNIINTQRDQDRQKVQFSNNIIPSQQNANQLEFGNEYTKQQYNYNSNQDKQSYMYKTQFSKEIVGQVSNEVKQNLALVFSLLADSINEAKGYSNIVQENILTSTTSQPQFQNINSAELAQITNQISELTSSQYSRNNQNSRTNTADIVSTSQPTTITTEQYRQTAKYENNSQNNVQQTHRVQYDVAPVQQLTQNEFYSSRLQSGTNGKNVNLVNQNPIFSGQLYQLPVPDVISQIYNIPSPANNIQSIDNLQKNMETGELQRVINKNEVTNINSAKQSSAEVEIIQSQSLPVSHPAKVQVTSSAQDLNNFLNTDDRITAQLQDKIVGTIKHPTDDNKIVTYKKNKSYYVFTKYDNETFKKNIQSNNNFNGELNAKSIQSNNPDNHIPFQFIPSVSYQLLDDVKDQQRNLNTFQINEFGSPKELSSTNGGYHIRNPNDREDIIENVNYSVDHSANQVNVLDNLYAGPSSYSAPQSSVGNLLKESTENHFNSRLEKFNDINGYSKVTPLPRFTY